MAAWESGQLWEPSGYRLGALGMEPLPACSPWGGAVTGTGSTC